jgi:germination protein, Ger(x)C family
MGKIKIALLIFIILINTALAAGCWNYREVEKLSIVAGIAVDKGADNKYQISVEIIQISGGKDSKTTTKVLTTDGKTMFDAARNMISISGKKLYWSHAKVIILSKEIASEGVLKVLEWYNRDAETREDVNILIANGATAKAMLEGQKSPYDIESFMLDEMIQDQISLSKAPIVNILNFDIASRIKGNAEALPAVSLKQMNGEMVSQVMGSAIIKDDKLVGFLNADETKDLTFIRDEVKGGILTVEMLSDTPTLVSLEIFSNKTDIKPVADSNNIAMNLTIKTSVAIDEMSGIGNYVDDYGRAKLEESAANMLKERIEALIKKMQFAYDADIFGFGIKLHENNSIVWKSVSSHWENTFKNLKVTVNTNVHIKNSAILASTSGGS